MFSFLATPTAGCVVGLEAMSSQPDAAFPGVTPPHAPATLMVRTTRIHDLPEGPGALLDLLPAEGALAWVRRGDGLAAWGEVARIETSGPTRFADAEHAWAALRSHAIVRDEVRLPGTGPVAFGSFAFDESSAAGGTLVVPRVVVGRRGPDVWITTLSTVEAVPTLGPAPTLDSVRPDDAAVTPPGAVTWSPGAVADDDWTAAVEEAVTRIRAGRLEKVVMARDVVARTERPIDVRWLLGRLADTYATCWTFCVDGMVGATPELLVRSEKGLVTSRVLAGTIRRTGGEEADLARAAVLAHSSKDLEEHEYAVTSVADALRPFCQSLNVPETPFVLHLPNVLHLASDVTGVLCTTARNGAAPSSLSLAEALHPTAAVCGTPTAAANELIREIEGLDRARYAGPVGWLGGDGDGEWGIALRSGALDPQDPHRIRLFAGCGVVAASEPGAELAETEAKLEPMRHALG